MQVKWLLPWARQGNRLDSAQLWYLCDASDHEVWDGGASWSFTTPVNLNKIGKIEKCFFFQYDLEASTHDFQKKHYSRVEFASFFFCVGLSTYIEKRFGPPGTARASWCRAVADGAADGWWELCPSDASSSAACTAKGKESLWLTVVLLCVRFVEVGWFVKKEWIKRPPSKRVTEIGIVETSCNSRWVKNPNSESRIL